MRCLRYLVTCLSAVLFAACAAPLQLPAGFVELGDTSAGYCAVTSDDARLWVRELQDPTEGSLEFWSESLRRDLVEQRGYEQVGTGELKNRDGDAGRWIEATSNVRGERIDYLVAVWSRRRSWLRSGDDILVVEFAARAEVYQSRIEQVRASLGTVHW